MKRKWFVSGIFFPSFNASNSFSDILDDGVGIDAGDLQSWVDVDNPTLSFSSDKQSLHLLLVLDS